MTNILRYFREQTDSWQSQFVKWGRRWRTRPNHLMRRHRLESIRFIERPLIFVSEIQRSGGMLMGRLLDNHPQLYAHPHELWIGRPNKYHWPKLDLSASPKTWFASLREDRVLRPADTARDRANKSALAPFMFSQRLQQEIFLKVVAERQPVTQRQVLDCYITSYFNAWVDYQGLYRDPQEVKYWSVFTARLAVDAEQCARFFADYPDGYLISIIRNPLSWYASARRHRPEEYAEIQAATQLWLQSTQAYVRNFNTYPGRVILLDFDQLILNTAGTMRRICDLVGLEFHESMTQPSFNGLPMVANTSFGTEDAGKIMGAAANRGSDLTEEEIALIKAQTDECYREALALAVRA